MLRRVNGTNSSNGRQHFVLALLLCWPWSSVVAQSDPPRPAAAAARAADARADSLAGELAPVGRWYTHGGSASRCGAAAAGPDFTGPLETAWEFAVDGEIEEEPLAWDEHVVVVSVKRKEGEEPKERTLHVLRLLDGKPVLPARRVASDVPLRPSLWNRVIAYREGKNGLRAEQIGATQLVRRLRYDTKGEVSSPLLFGNEVYYTQDGRLERIDLGASQPAWSYEGNFRGRVSLLGDHVFGLRFARLSEPTLALVDRHSGKLVVQEHSTEHGHAVDHSVDVCIAATRGCAAVRFDVEAARSDPDISNTVLFTRVSAAGVERLSASGFGHSEQPPVLWDGIPFLVYAGDEGRYWQLCPRRRGRWWTFDVADAEHYPDVVSRRLPATVIHDAIVVGDVAFDAETLRVLWQADLKPTQRTVPAGRTLLVTSGARLIALRDPHVPAAHTAVDAARDVGSGAVVLQDGRVHRGKYRFDPAAKAVTLAAAGGRKGEVVPLAQVLWAEDGTTPLHFADAAVVARAMQLLIEDQARKGYAALAVKAGRSNDPRTISRYLVEALELGADEGDVVAAQRQLERLRRAPLRVEDAVVRAVDAEEAKLRQALADLPWQRAQALPREAAPLRALLTAIALRLAGDHPAASAWVREQLPQDMPVPEPFVAEQWLLFAEAARRRPMRVVAETGPDHAYEREQLAKARASWRKDLMAVCSDRLCVLAPPDVAGAVGMCLATGELVVDCLEGMFAGIGTSRAGSQRLLIKLYGTRDEYVDRAAQEVIAFDKAQRERERAEAKERGEEVDGGGKPADAAEEAKKAAEQLLREKRGLALTLGIFVPDEGVTRLYMPAGKEGHAGVLATFAHELTHHWLELRGPRFEMPKDARPRIARPGHWIVEGFPTFVESFAWDLERKAFATDGSSMELEMFAASAASDRNPWSRQLTYSQVNMHRHLSKEFRTFVRRNGYLGPNLLSQCNFFYVQGAATCAYLYHAEEGKHRRALLEYVVNYYSGLTDKLAPDVAFDVSADQLGAQVSNWFAMRRQTAAAEGDKK